MTGPERTRSSGCQGDVGQLAGVKQRAIHACEPVRGVKPQVPLRQRARQMPDGKARKRPQIDVDSQVRELNLDRCYGSAFEERLTPVLHAIRLLGDASFGAALGEHGKPQNGQSACPNTCSLTAGSVAESVIRGSQSSQEALVSGHDVFGSK